MGFCFINKTAIKTDHLLIKADQRGKFIKITIEPDNTIPLKKLTNITSVRSPLSEFELKALLVHVRKIVDNNRFTSHIDIKNIKYELENFTYSDVFGGNI